MVVLEEVHGEIVLGGSRDGMEKIGSTTTQPPEVATHNGAHRGASSKESACHKEHFGVITPQRWWSGGEARRPPPPATIKSCSLPFDYVKTQIQKMQLRGAEGKLPYSGS
ncbi:hypothetical protein CJ030_MR0G006813 [Morella rubra]|uniref:Uncharacterized protein n=1 Tax=Morella rubra TaxID=262757 RepID=A0A6A1UK51_9ROSI|nr:hypothetical protein CJ030_MR0G006813 [Morella rubra]